MLLSDLKAGLMDIEIQASQLKTAAYDLAKQALNNNDMNSHWKYLKMCVVFEEIEETAARHNKI